MQERMSAQPCDIVRQGKDRRDLSVEIGLVSCGRLAVMATLSMLERPVSNVQQLSSLDI